MTYKELQKLADVDSIDINTEDTGPDHTIVEVRFSIGGVPMRCLFSPDLCGVYGMETVNREYDSEMLKLMLAGADAVRGKTETEAVMEMLQ